MYFFLAYTYFDVISPDYTKEYPEWFRYPQAGKRCQELFVRCDCPLDTQDVYRAYIEMAGELGLREQLRDYDIRKGIPIFRKI